MEIVLKKFSPRDVDDYFRLVGDAKVMAMITERAIPFEEATRDYDKMLKANSIHPDFGYFRVLDASDQRFIGLGKLEVLHANMDKAELGYMLLPENWGKGIGGKVANLLANRARLTPGIRGLFAIIDPANISSRKILLNNGFVSKEFKDFDGLPGEVLERVW